MSNGDRDNAHRDSQVEDKGQQRIIISVAFVDILWFFLDVWFIWPQSHVAALWIFLGFIGLQILFSLPIQSSLIRSGCFVVVIGCGLIAQALLPSVLPPETETHGWLIPANEPTPATLCGGVKSFIVEFGDLAMTTSMSDHYTAITIAHCSSIVLDRTADGLTVSTDLFGEDGRLVVRIVKNEFHLIAQELSYTERSDDRSSLIVYDPKGDPLFRVKYVNSLLIQIDGFFHCPQGTYRLGFGDGIRYPAGGGLSDLCMDGSTGGIFVQ